MYFILTILRGRGKWSQGHTIHAGFGCSTMYFQWRNIGWGLCDRHGDVMAQYLHVHVGTCSKRVYIQCTCSLPFELGTEQMGKELHVHCTSKSGRLGWRNPQWYFPCFCGPGLGWRNPQWYFPCFCGPGFNIRSDTNVDYWGFQFLLYRFYVIAHGRA